MGLREPARREPGLSAVPVLEYSQTGVNTAALPDAAVGEQRQRVARRQAGGDLLQRGAVGAADEDAEFAGAGGQEVGHLREAGEVEVADGDVHAVGVGVGVGEDGAEVGGEVGGAVGEEDGHCRSLTTVKLRGFCTLYLLPSR